MNELQRQHYLSALGVDTYMPRWHLPFAPISVVCELPQVLLDSQSDIKRDSQNESVVVLPSQSIHPQKSTNIEHTAASPVNNLISGILETKKTSSAIIKPVSAADILAQLDSKPVNVDAFSLSIWRPTEGVMIVDSRNSKLALPTEILFNNILRSFFSDQFLKPQEEVLRWPMVENSFAKRSANDARIELQTWLSVQHEIRPIQYLWLMGSNAASYLLPEQTTFVDSLFQPTRLVDSMIKALVLPSLNEILQKPILKQKIYAAIRHHHFASL